MDYNRLALETAQLSLATKRKVGAVLVGSEGELATACNYNPFGDPCEHIDGTTNMNVIHAEEAACEEFFKLYTTVPKSALILMPKTMYVTQPPCGVCQKIMQNFGVTEVVIVEEFMKFDTDKLRFDLIPPRVEESLAKVLTYGAKKYKPDNWRKGDIERYEAALLRHLNAYRLGEACDKESGLLHLEHAFCNIAFLLELHADKEK